MTVSRVRTVHCLFVFSWSSYFELVRWQIVFGGSNTVGRSGCLLSENDSHTEVIYYTLAMSVAERSLVAEAPLQVQTTMHSTFDVPVQKRNLYHQ